MRRKYVEIVMSIGSVGLILLVLASFNSGVRQQVSEHWSSGAVAEVTAADRTARQVTGAIVQAAKDQGLANTPIVLFVLGAGVLVLFMVRT